MITAVLLFIAIVLCAIYHKLKQIALLLAMIGNAICLSSKLNHGLKDQLKDVLDEHRTLRH